MSKKKKFYAYFVPATKKSGVTDDWATCERMVKGVTGARYRSFESKADAEAWLKAGARYDARPIEPWKKLEPGIYFDAGTGRGTGVEISVTDERGQNLLHKTFSKNELNKFGKHLIEHSEATNNYGELLALRSALEIAAKENIKKIFGDSKLVIEFWSKWRMKAKNLPEETVALARVVAAMREAFEENGGTIERISGAQNPADLGFHK
jgi:viroplasmin and RNaseH domain-containing protein